MAVGTGKRLDCTAPLFVPAFDRFFVLLPLNPQYECLLFVDEATRDGQSFSISTKPTAFTVTNGAKEIKKSGPVSRLSR